MHFGKCQGSVSKEELGRLFGPDEGGIVKGPAACSYTPINL